jgi:hypothetical protein
MKLRLEGTKAEIEWAIESLKKVYSVMTVSKLYPNRDKVNYRCYLEVIPYSLRSDSVTELSSLEQEDLEVNPEPWDAVLGGNKDASDAN